MKNLDSTISLNQLEKNELAEKKMNTQKGGMAFGCCCTGSGCVCKEYHVDYDWYHSPVLFFVDFDLYSGTGLFETDSFYFSEVW